MRARCTRAYLQFSGYRVAEATNGLEAIEKTLELMPDIILMDLALPKVDGWEATKRLKSDERTKHIPIVALTGHALAGFAEGAREGGMRCVCHQALSARRAGCRDATDAGDAKTRQDGPQERIMPDGDGSDQQDRRSWLRPHDAQARRRERRQTGETGRETDETSRVPAGAIGRRRVARPPSRARKARTRPAAGAPAKSPNEEAPVKKPAASTSIASSSPNGR